MREDRADMSAAIVLADGRSEVRFGSEAVDEDGVKAGVDVAERLWTWYIVSTKG